MKDEPAMDYNSSQLGVEGNQSLCVLYCSTNFAICLRKIEQSDKKRYIEGVGGGITLFGLCIDISL